MCGTRCLSNPLRPSPVKIYRSLSLCLGRRDTAAGHLSLGAFGCALPSKPPKQPRNAACHVCKYEVVLEQRQDHALLLTSWNYRANDPPAYETPTKKT